MVMVAKARNAAREFVKYASSTTPVAEKNSPNNNASSGCIRRAGSGRVRVRFINASRSRSHHWFSAAAPPAQSAVPTRVADRMTQSSGPLHPRRKPTSVVMRTRKERRALTRVITSPRTDSGFSGERAEAVFMRIRKPGRVILRGQRSGIARHRPSGRA